MKTCLCDWRFCYCSRKIIALDPLRHHFFITGRISHFLLFINPQATTILAIAILFLLIISFVVSGSEVAFFSLSPKDVNILKTKQDVSWKRIANLLEEELRAKGVAVVIEAVHTCMAIRGIRKPESVCVTSAMKGIFRKSLSSRAEIMTLIYGDRR